MHAMSREQYDMLYDAIHSQAEAHYVTHWRQTLCIKDCARCDSWYSLLDALNDYSDEDASPPPAPAPLTTGQLAVWLDALTRQYGPDLPLYVQAGPPSAPCQQVRDAWVQRAPEGHRVIVLSALPTAPQQEETPPC